MIFLSYILELSVNNSHYLTLSSSVIYICVEKQRGDILFFHIHIHTHEHKDCQCVKMIEQERLQSKKSTYIVHYLRELPYSESEIL